MDFRRHCEEIAGRFLQTAVIVDDEAYIRQSIKPPIPLETPDRSTVARTTNGEAEVEERHGEYSNHSLDAGLLTESFSKCGLICAVVAPGFGTEVNDAEAADLIPPAVRRADIVILDWKLNHDDGEKTVSILKGILMTDADERLRLVAIYTGEQDIAGIGRTILGQFAEFETDEHNVVLSRRHCRIVIYAKSGTHLAANLADRSVSESEIPGKLIADFASMTAGLLPNIALTSLAAIRESVHRILDRFDRELDPAFLTHRACLPSPSDSQQHMVNQLANELHAVMDDVVATEDPAGMGTVTAWLDTFLGENFRLNLGDGKVASREETIALLEKGIAQRKPAALNKGKGFRSLTAGFSGIEDPDHRLDSQFAWMFNFRTVFSAPSPTLRLGSILWRAQEIGKSFFLCMRPRCDSVRLQTETTFLFLPLVEPDDKTVQIVLRTQESTYRRVSVCMDMSRWSLAVFEPNQDTKSVIAEHDNSDFYFTDTAGMRFRWLGELKMEFAQRIAHEFASGLSRVAVTDSEWLRREAGQRN